MDKKNYFTCGDKIAFHPGYYLEEIIDYRNESPEEFAEISDISADDLNLIISGEKDIDEDIAMKLSTTIGTSPEYWINLQKQFDGMKERYEEYNGIEIEV